MILCILFLAVVPFLLGQLVTKIYGEKEKGNIYRYIVGMCSLICVFEIVCVGAIKMEISFTKTLFLFLFIIILLSILGLISFIRTLISTPIVPFLQSFFHDFSWRAFPIILLFLLQCLNYVWMNPYIGNDITKEIINTTIATDTMYQYHPLTGKLFEIGMTPVGKLYILPLFYSGLSKVFCVDASTLLYLILPIWVLLMGYFVMFLWGRLLFNKKNQKHIQSYFLMVYGVLSLFGGFYLTSEFYWLSHSAWRGETIIATIIIPFILYLLINKVLGKTRYLVVLLTLFATICMANLGEGFWLCVIEILLYFIIKSLGKAWEVFRCRN
jgi:hypothetical protein